MKTSTAHFPDSKRTEGVGIYFGQFSDNSKTKQQNEYCWKAMDLIGKKEHVEWVATYFEYLKDELYNNVEWKRENGQLSFQIWQGPVMARGDVSGHFLRAEVTIGRIGQPDNPLMNYLLEENRNNSYCRISLIDQQIGVSLQLDLTRPNILTLLYRSLGELCLQAEKVYKHIQASFPLVVLADEAVVISIPPAEAAVKYKYFREWTEEILDLLEEQDVTAVSYLLRTLAYRLDFLMAPEGPLKKAFNDIHWIYFADDRSSEESRNQRMEEVFRQLLAKPEEEITASFYRTLYTFTKRRRPGETEVMDVRNELKEYVEFYQKMEDEEVVQSLQEQAPLNIQYVCAMARPWTALFVVYMQVTYAEYFKELGMPAFRSEEIIDEQGVREAIRNIEGKWKTVYPDFHFNTDELDCSDDEAFRSTFIYQLASQRFVL